LYRRSQSLKKSLKKGGEKTIRPSVLTWLVQKHKQPSKGEGECIGSLGSEKEGVAGGENPSAKENQEPERSVSGGLGATEKLILEKSNYDREVVSF